MNNNIEQLTRLADLKKKKIITAEEFEAQKVALLTRNLDDLKVKGSKSQLVYDLLAFILGTLGIHNFYAGYKKRGFTQLAITLGSVMIVLGVVFNILVGMNDTSVVSDEMILELILNYPLIIISLLAGVFVTGWVAYDIYIVHRTPEGEMMEPAPTGRVVFFVLQLLSFIYQLTFVFID